MELVGLVLLLIVCPVVILLTFLWRKSRTDEILANWARENNVEVVESESRPFRGPFFWSSNDHQTVRRIVVRDCDGNERSGYIRCGSYFGGLLSEQTKVKWDDEEASLR